MKARIIRSRDGSPMARLAGRYAFPENLDDFTVGETAEVMVTRKSRTGRCYFFTRPTGELALIDGFELRTHDTPRSWAIHWRMPVKHLGLPIRFVDNTRKTEHNAQVPEPTHVYLRRSADPNMLICIGVRDESDLT